MSYEILMNSERMKRPKKGDMRSAYKIIGDSGVRWQKDFAEPWGLLPHDLMCKCNLPPCRLHCEPLGQVRWKRSGDNEPIPSGKEHLQWKHTPSPPFDRQSVPSVHLSFNVWSSRKNLEKPLNHRRTFFHTRPHRELNGQREMMSHLFSSC